MNFIENKTEVFYYALFLGMCPWLYAAQPLANEMAEQGRWVSAKFAGKAEQEAARSGLVVVENHEYVHKNGRFEKPFIISGTRYTRGLFCHATSKLIVRLPSAGKTFQTVVGVDTNDQTSGGRGSIVFSVHAKGQEKYNSGLMKEGMAGIPVKVDLDGASEFVIAVGDGGDGIACDQADWVNAKVELADGGEIWLGDMTILDDTQKPLTAEPQFSFTYDKKSFAELKNGWETKRKSERVDPFRMRHETTWRDPKTGLVVRCVGIEWKDFPTVEWTLYFKNEGRETTPILENIQALNLTVNRTQKDEYILHHFSGGGGAPSAYQPNRAVLTAGKQETFSGLNGRPTGRSMSYFNLEWSGQGMLIAVGWPGQWAARFTRDQGAGLQIRAGQELTHCKLLPGEEIRTPLIVLQFWQGGDWIRAQNIWRQWMLQHNLPRPGGKLPAPQLAGGIAGYSGLALMFNCREEDHIRFLDRYLKEDIKLDYWWMDLGWFLLPKSYQKVVGLKDDHEYPLEDLGTFTADYNRFPNGIRAISDYCHAHGMKTILWFDPEHIFAGSWQTEKNPQWLLSPPNIPGIESQINQGLPLENRKLLNMGNPQAVEWLNNRIAQVLNKEGIDTYRLDYNIEPLIFWQASDAEDRQGITENHYVQGFLSHLDDQLRRRPDLLIDNCASGGMRNDLETMRRSVPLWRSDYAGEPVGMQGMTYGMAFWLPYFGHWGGQLDPYTFRSNMMPAMIMGHDLRNALDFEYLRKRIAQWRKIAPYYLGDYYPLTPHSLENNAWLAWQFDQREIGEGMVQAFRRQDSMFLGCQLKLFGLDPAARYEISNLDTSDKTIATGQQLMQKGLKIIIENQPGAVVLVYKKAG